MIALEPGLVWAVLVVGVGLVFAAGGAWYRLGNLSKLVEALTLKQSTRWENHYEAHEQGQVANESFKLKTVSDIAGLKAEVRK